MQVFVRAVVLACTKFGIAIAAKRPMIATTIIISTSVKPPVFLVSFIEVLLYPFRVFFYENPKKRTTTVGEMLSMMAINAFIPSPCP